MELVVLDPGSPIPPYEQVRAQIARAIETGGLRPADRLPTVRGLATELGLAVNTVARAYRELELEGLVSTRGRHGTTVAGHSSVQRAQAVVEARRFVARMRELGIGASESLALVRQESDRPGQA